jgi:hypothetical protein
MLLTGLGGALAFGGYKWYERSKPPDIVWLGKNRELLANIADTIIPSTDTPGARATGAPDFMFTLLKDCTDSTTLNIFIDGLKDIEAYCRSNYGHSFSDCTGPDRISTLARFEKRDRPLSGILGKAERRFLGKPFFTTLKEFTVIAYCTSEQGATHGLAYVAVPVSYHGCLPWQPGQPAWATK